MMVDLQNLKNAIDGGQYSEQGKAAMIAIVDAAIAKGAITADEKQKLLNIIDLEIDQNDLEIKANDKVAEMLETYGAAIDAATQTASNELDSITEEKPAETPAETPTEMPAAVTEAPVEPVQPPTQ